MGTLMESVIELILHNKEWLFSGALVAIPLSLLGFLVRSWFRRKDNTSTINQTSAHDSTVYQANRDITFNTSPQANNAVAQKELEVLPALAEQLVTVGAAMEAIRPHRQFINLNESHKERLTRHLRSFQETLGEFQRVAERNKGFYPDGLFPKVQEVLRICRLELSEALMEGYEEPLPSDWYKRGEEYFRDFVHIKEDIDSLIQRRIGTLRHHSSETVSP